MAKKVAEPKQYSVSVPFLMVCIILGIIATAQLLYLLNKPSNQPQETAKKVQPTPTVTPGPFFLKVDEPGNEATEVSGEILVAGSTASYTIIAVYGDIDDTLLMSDGEGKFEGTVFVGPGSVFGVSAFSNAGEQKSYYFMAGDEDKRATESSNLKQKMGAVKLKEALAGSGSAKLSAEKLPVREADDKTIIRRYAIISTVVQADQGAILLADDKKVMYDAKTIVTATGKSTDKIALKQGYRLIAIGEASSAGFMATRIHIVPVVPTAYQDHLPSFNSSESSSQGGINLNSIINNIQGGILPTLSLENPTLSPTPAPVL